MSKSIQHKCQSSCCRPHRLSVVVVRHVPHFISLYFKCSHKTDTFLRSTEKGMGSLILEIEGATHGVALHIVGLAKVGCPGDSIKLKNKIPIFLTGELLF